MAVPATASKQRAVKPQKGGLERRNRYGILFCLPFILAFLVFNIYPVFRTLQMSFMNYKGFGKETFVWFDNYVRAFKDPLFRDAFGNTLKMWGVNIVLQLGLALLLTIIFNDMKYRMKGLGIFRALFYLPDLIACTSVAFLFKTLLDWRFGSINQILMTMGVISHHGHWRVHRKLEQLPDPHADHQYAGEAPSARDGGGAVRRAGHHHQHGCHLLGGGYFRGAHYDRLLLLLQVHHQRHFCGQRERIRLSSPGPI